MKQNTENLLVEGLERLGLMAAQIRKNGGEVSPLEADVLLQELRDLYVAVLGQTRPKEKETEAADSRAAAIEAARRADEEAARRAEEEAAARKRAEEEAAARKKAEEEKKAAEEFAARKKAEAEAARIKAEEEAARKKAEEEARRLAEAEKPIFAPEEPAKTEASVMPPMMETIEGNVNDTLFEADSPSKSADKETRTAEGSSLFSYLNSSVEEKPSVRTLADTLNPQRANVEERLERKVNAKKVDDLRTIININDKFSFMSELFHNNMKAYNDFILRLNAYVDRQQALDYVADIAKQYSWNNESLAVKNFYKVFDRKF
ncbi:MAG: hypothetical protein J6W95_01570 [Bacteroidales bacterium]|nr:hypothetical protein [Bacteroidales bacterium]